MNRARVPLLPSRVRWLAVAAVAVGILAASLAPSAGTATLRGPLGVAGLDKYLHGLAFAGFALVLAYALARRDPATVALAVFAAAVGFGLLVELLQAPLAHRTFSLADLAADAVGAALVAVGWHRTAGRLRFRQPGARA